MKQGTLARPTRKRRTVYDQRSTTRRTVPMHGSKSTVGSWKHSTTKIETRTASFGGRKRRGEQGRRGRRERSEVNVAKGIREHDGSTKTWPSRSFRRDHGNGNKPKANFSPLPTPKWQAELERGPRQTDTEGAGLNVAQKVEGVPGRRRLLDDGRRYRSTRRATQYSAIAQAAAHTGRKL